LHEDRCTFLISRSVLLRMRNVSDKSCRENQNTHCTLNNFFLENRTLYEIMWKSTVETARPQMTVWRLRIASRVPKATDTHSEYVIPAAFPLQQWLHESASVLRYTNSACLPYCSLTNKCSRIHINIAPTCFGLRPSSGSLY
jgi:hypothetical protein